MAISYGTYTITEVQEGSQIWTSSTAPTTPNYTFDVSHLTGDSDVPIREGDIILNSYYRYTVLSISSDGTTVLTGNRTSIRGATGAASITYALIVSNLAIVKDKDGNLSPSTITVTAKSQTGSNAMANYTGRIKIETTTNNSTWTSRINEDVATKTYTIPSDTVAIRCSLYLKGGTTTLLDQQTVPVISDGIDGTNITITSTSVTYQKGTSGTVKPTGTWETGVQSVGQGEYLWTRTIVNYSDGSSTEAYSVSRNAVNGTNGTNGKDGTSPTVSSTVTEYAQSTNGTTPPTSGWDTAPKTATAGQYMWTRVTVTYSDSATAVSYTVSKNGTNGTNGINTATVYLYKKGTTAPSVPSGNTTYTFSTKKLTGTLDSWTQEIPTTGSGQCYVTAAVASSNGTTDTIGTGEWSTPIQFNGINGTNGTNGTNGLNQATIFLYKRGTSVTKPTTSVTYTFSTGKLSAEPNGWTRNIPTINGSPCWVVSATAIGNGTTATIAGSNWSDPTKLVEDGVDGKDAYSIVLTNENHTFAGNTTSAIASEIECNVIAYKGTTQIAATIGTITGQPTGMTTEILNNGTVNSAFKVTVTTSMVTRNGVLNVPITVDGKTFIKKFTYSLALKGSIGTSENLLMDVYASSLTKVDAPWDRYLSDASNSTITGEFIAEENLPDPNATHFYRITDSSASTHGRGYCFYSDGTPPFITGHTYRIGCWVRKHSGSPKVQITLGSYGSWMPTQRKIENTEWEWIEVVRTFGDTDSNVTTQSNTYKKLYFYFYNNNVAGSSLDMCGFKMEELQTNSGTARNLLLDTEKLTNWGVVNGATISDGVASFPSITADSWREIYPAKNFKYELIRNQYAIFSIKVKGNVDEKCCVNLCIGVDTTETAYARKKYFSQYIYFVGTGEWQTVCSALPIFDYMFNTGSGTVDFDNCWVTVRIGAVNKYWNAFQAKEPQLSLGTTATSWSRAPEDIDEAIDNIEVGGRNLLSKDNILSFVNPYTEEKYIYTGLYGAGAGLKFPASIFEIGTKYVLSFKFKKISGTLTAIGGHCSGFSSFGKKFIIDGKKEENRIYSQGYLMNDDSDVHSVEVYLIFNGNASDNNLYIQPNRGAYTQSNDNKFQIWDLQLEKGNKPTQWTPAPEDIEEEVSNLRTDLQAQIDEKIQTYYQATAPSWSNTTDRAKHNGDLWYCTESDPYTGYEAKNVYRYDSASNTWVEYSATSELFDKVDGKSTIFYGTTSDTFTDIDTGDYLVNSVDGSSYRWDGSKWVKVTDYKTAIDNIEIGGRNLVWNSNFHSPIEGTWSNWGSPTTREIVTINGENWMHIVTTANAFQGYSQSQANRNGFGEIQAGEQIIFSFDAYSKIEGQKGCIGVHWRDSNDTNISQNWASFDLTTTKKRYITPVFKVPTNAVGFNMMIGQRTAAAQEIWITNIKGEKGNKATDWTPAPEDVETDIEDARKVATNYLSADSTGIMVADMKDGEQLPSTATGRNVFIDNDSVDIRDGQNILASFTGTNTNFYDLTKREIASFGITGVQVGNKEEQHFMVTSDSISAINENGSPVFSISLTDGVIDNVVQVGNSTTCSNTIKTITLDEHEYTSSYIFYVDKIFLSISIPNNGSQMHRGMVCVPKGFTVKEGYSPISADDPTTLVLELPKISFYYGTATQLKYVLSGVFNYYGKSGSYTYTGNLIMDYNGDRTLTLHPYEGTWVDNSDSSNTGSSSTDIYNVPYVMATGSSRAPAMTFGTRKANTEGIVAPLSITIGESLYANSDNQLSIGRYNTYNDPTSQPLAFVIGNGNDELVRSNALTVDWSGNLNVGGKISGIVNNESMPLFKVVNKEFTSIGINPKAAYQITRYVGIANYTALAIAGIKVYNDSKYNSSTYADSSWCVIPRFWLSKTTTYDLPDNTTDAIFYYIWNQNTSKPVMVTISIRIVYVLTNAFDIDMS